MFRIMLKRCFGRRRVFVTFLVVMTLSVWYICYQAFSVHKLGEELSAESVKNKDHPYFRKYQKGDIPIHLYPIDGISVEGNNEFDNSSNGGRKFNSSFIKPHPIRIKGLLIKNLKFYIPNSRGVFLCLNNEQEIPYNQVNNDYCDCEDGSDEPSTSACPNGRFYCGHQLKSKEVFIVSSRVNDGICDCCDGSDEWDNAEVPPHAKINAYYEGKLGIDQTPCRNRCPQ